MQGQHTVFADLRLWPRAFICVFRCSEVGTWAKVLIQEEGLETYDDATSLALQRNIIRHGVTNVKAAAGAVHICQDGLDENVALIRACSKNV